MYLIRELAHKYKLTRTALLHYDSIGLLCPSTRSDAGYRLYSDEDEEKLRKIMLFRSMGIPLEQIKMLLESNTYEITNALLLRLGDINSEIETLKQKQQNIIDLLKSAEAFSSLLTEQDMESLTDILLSGISPAEWHANFEAMSPAMHGEFLRLIETIPEEKRTSFLNAARSLPEDERKQLKKLIKKKNRS